MSGLVQLELPEDGRAAPAGTVDAEALERDLRAVMDGEVRFDRGTRGIYSTDASSYRQVPIGVVLPRHRRDVVEGVRVCREHGAPVLGRGGGTSLAGQCCNVAVVFDFSRHMNRVLHVDPERRIARVEPGCVLDVLRDAAGEHGLTFGPDPSTHDRCVMGGMIANNACGVRSLLSARHHGARTSDNLHRLEVLTWGGETFWCGETDDAELEAVLTEGGRRAEMYRQLQALAERYGDEIRERFPDIPRRVSGYNLDDLLPENGFHVARALAGSEGTCGLFLEAEVHLVPDPPATSLVVLGYPDVYAAADHVVDILDHDPIGLEGMDSRLVEYIQLRSFHADALHGLPDGDAFLLVELGADDPDEASRLGGRLLDDLLARERAPHGKVVDDPEEAELMWRVRESGLAATADVPGLPPTWPGWEDTAVHPRDLGEYLRDFRALLERYDYRCSFYGHFGQGLLHVRIDFDMETAEGLERYMEFGRECADLVAGYGGSLSGEHGDGQARAWFLERIYGGELVEAFRRFRAVWDPDGMMNPGKVVDPYRPDTNLVLGTDWNPPVHEDLQFAYPDDGGAFHNAANRCVGVGECRREGGGTMCPSYMVTRDEEHSTRGRARVLYEMVRGDVVADGWKSEEVFDALDLCLSCKGCKSDCPVSVDMATYKAEFAYHYYEGRPRPRNGYAMGLIHWWARLGSKVPRLANWMMDRGPLARAMKWAGDIHPDRELPRLSRPHFRRRWEREWSPAPSGRPRVIFWPDTFNAYFHADTAWSGAKVLEALGYDVVIPERPLCCGRPLYDFGWLGVAKKLLRRILDDLGEEIDAGVPVVGVEPSCVATFRDELTNFFPNDLRARRLAAQTRLLGEFLDEHAGDGDLPRLDEDVLLHGHCHQKSVLDFDADRRVLERMGCRVEVPDSGCCGMAGPFGFERGHYDVAQACGERVLLPAVRERAPGTTVLTDGFSCREMIEQNDPVRALNLADFVWRAMEERDGNRRRG